LRMYASASLPSHLAASGRPARLSESSGGPSWGFPGSRWRASWRLTWPNLVTSEWSSCVRGLERASRRLGRPRAASGGLTPPRVLSISYDPNQPVPGSECFLAAAHGANSLKRSTWTIGPRRGVATPLPLYVQRSSDSSPSNPAIPPKVSDVRLLASCNAGVVAIGNTGEAKMVTPDEIDVNNTARLTAQHAPPRNRIPRVRSTVKNSMYGRPMQTRDRQRRTRALPDQGQ
jgi:hypothetical protein